MLLVRQVCPHHCSSLPIDFNLYLIYIGGRIPKKQCDITMDFYRARLLRERISLGFLI